MSEPLLRVEGLRKVFRFRGQADDLIAVDDVSLEVAPGASLGIVGESGSGKTTLARMIVGLERPTAGTIEIAGRNCTQAPRRASERRRRGRDVQIVFQDPYTSLDPTQRVRDALREVLKLHFGLDRDELDGRVDTLLDQVGLDARQGRARPGALSGGQRQRAAIARALAAEPTLLILDEAVSALDVSIQAQILNLLDAVRAQTGVAFLFVSHDLAVVRQVADDTIVMRHGRVVEAGPTARVIDHARDPYTQMLLRSVPRPGWRPRRTLQAADVANA